MLFVTTLLLSILAGAGTAERTYHCEITERVTESGTVIEDFGRFELMIEDGNGVRLTAVLRQAVSPGDWQARFMLQSDEAGTLWFDTDNRIPQHQDPGVDSLSLNLEDGALGVNFEWTLPTAPGQPNLIIAQATLMGRCCTEDWPREGRCRE
jgi:hypothetical protein